MDTIVARATPPGLGALALIRLSGPRVRELLEALGAGRAVKNVPRTATLCLLKDPRGRPLEQAVVTFFPAPGSYTGEDVAELGVHGNPVGVDLVVEACRAYGARQAEPGEFTRRAYFAGKMDLLQVEALDALFQARSPGVHRAALHQMEGGLSRRIAALRAELIELEAHLAYHVDFPEEDEAPIPVEGLATRARSVERALTQLAETAPGGVRMGEGATVVFAGPPNAGKSSLFNALLGTERAIVTPHPGTTRDAIEALAVVGEFPFRLIDTAGLRDGADPLEALGIEVAQRHLEGADVVLLCWPADVVPDEAAISLIVAAAGGVVLRVQTCVDRGSGKGPGGGALREAETPWLPVSSHTGEGVSALKAALCEAAFRRVAPDTDSEDPTVVMRARQASALERSAQALRAFARALDQGVPAEWAAVHLAQAGAELESMVGRVAVDDVLDAVFGTFCVGK